MKKSLFALLSLLMVLGTAQATVLVTGFDGYDNAALIGQDSPQGQTWTYLQNANHPLTVSSGSLPFVAAGEDVTVGFSGGAVYQNTTLYVGMDLTIASGLAADTEGYVGAFSANTEPTALAYGARIYGKTIDASTLNFGISAGFRGGRTYGATAYNLDQSYRIVVAYSFSDAASNNETVTMYVNPTSGDEGEQTIYATYTRTSAIGTYPLVDTVSQFQVFQDVFSGSMEDLVVATTFSEAAAIPEPTAFAWCAGILVVLFVAYRRRR